MKTNKYLKKLYVAQECSAQLRNIIGGLIISLEGILKLEGEKEALENEINLLKRKRFELKQGVDELNLRLISDEKCCIKNECVVYYNSNKSIVEIKKRGVVKRYALIKMWIDYDNELNDNDGDSNENNV